MAEYIEREAAIEKLNRLCDRVCQYSKAQRKYMCGACPLGDAFTVIEDDIPAADVRPVIFCKDCDCWNEWDSAGRESLGNYVCSCAHWSVEDGPVLYTRPTDFCSYGERVEES